MTVHALISGVLFRAPEQRLSKSGKAFWSATLKVRDGDATAWWKLLVFSESAGAELMRLGDGDAVSAQGVFKAEPAICGHSRTIQPVKSVAYGSFGVE
jgi:hypothetical protein